MRHTQLHFLRNETAAASRFRTGVSLHSHTLHSREGLDFIPRVAGTVPLFSAVLRHCEQRYLAWYGVPLDLARGWWTPPLSPADAWRLEAAQIEDRLNCAALVSLTDHDNIEAAGLLQVVHGNAVPISVEWTVPYADTFFHLGVHNLPADPARAWMQELADLTASPNQERLHGILIDLNALPQVLLVLNHPFWDEKGIGAERHTECLRSFIEDNGRSIHALELNGLRPAKENQLTIRLARESGLPLISGGDRHGREPNTILNLTNSPTFDGFIEEIRGGQSHVLFMPQYHEAYRLRILQNLCEILRDDDTHSLGWKKWSDRIFYRCEDETVRSLSELWRKGAPFAVQFFVNVVRLMEHRRMRSALRFALREKEEPAL